jgi:hypothetical protein
MGASAVSTNKPEPPPRTIIGFLGVGLDNQDGHRRLTTSEHFLLLGGSEETHERMQDTAIKFAEALRRRGKRLKDASLDEVIDLFHEAQE